MGDLKAIQTVYKGYRFRSRLEARWAVFFDALGIKWEYEKEGYDLDGIWYLPDFWLPELECWIEVKGKEPTEQEHAKAQRLAETSNHPVILLGEMPAPHDEHRMGYKMDSDMWLTQVARFQGYAPELDLSLDRISEDRKHIYAWDWKKPFYWTICGFCGEVALACYWTTWTTCKCLHEAISRWPRRPRKKSDRQSLWLYMHSETIGNLSYRDELIGAYDAARQARFEHGEQP